MVNINGERLLHDLRRVAEFGKFKTGVHRPTFSPQDVQSRHWLAKRMEEAGLEATIDGVGTVFGRAPNARRIVLTGSHSETQAEAGWLDGIMGIIYGIETARALSEDPSCAGLAVDVAAWVDEESWFVNLLGSRSFVGMLTDEQLNNAKSRIDGKTLLSDALKKAGFYGRPRVHLEKGRYVGYMEAHIEQGGALEHAGQSIGVVTGIVGLRLFKVIINGIQNHAGTTPMPIRKDARAAATKLCNAIDEAFAKLAHPKTVWTIGKIDLVPNMPSVIPGHAEMMVQMRDVDDSLLDRLEATLRELVCEHDKKGPCSIHIEHMSEAKPAISDSSLVDHLAAAAEEHASGKWTKMPSGAGHDAQIIALKLPSVMMFVPSIGGISHHWTENTSDEDLILGCQVFAKGVERVLKAE